MALSVQESLTSHVTSANEDDKQNKAHTFQYNLNTAKTKKKIYEGALRDHFQREDKKGCINLIFSGGAFNVVVFKAINELQNGPKHFIVGKEEVEKISIDPRKELSGKHVDTKIEFKVNTDKIVIHIYNSTQKLTIQGRKHKWFVDNYLELFIKLRISKALPEIELINKTVITSLNSQENEAKTLSEEAEVMKCDKCDFKSKTAENMRKHIVDIHTVNCFYGLNIASVTNEGNKVIKDTVTILTEENTEKSDNTLEKEAGTEEYFKCTECDNNLESKKELEKHVELHTQAHTLSHAFHICRVCEHKVFPSDLQLQCNKCIYFFHKKCTSRKDSRGKAWRTTPWSCDICSYPRNITYLNPEADVFSPPASSSVPSMISTTTTSIVSSTNTSIMTSTVTPTMSTLPQLSGKHRKSKVNIENPEKEFLLSTVDTLKVSIAKSDLEIKKLKESNDIKAKRIMNLEAQLEEAKNTITKHKCLVSEERQEHPYPSHTQELRQMSDGFQEIKVANIETRTNAIEHNISLLSAKLENLQFNFLAEKKSNSADLVSRTQETPKTYLCDICEYESAEKSIIKNPQRVMP